MLKKIEKISIKEARKVVLLSQKIPPVNQKGSALSSTLSAIEHLGYIQIDTISVIQRAHHHTLWNRNPRYSNSHLNDLMAQKQIFEYWSHAAAYLPIKDYRFSLPKKKAIASKKENHWYKVEGSLMQSVLNRIISEGPLMARDFDHKGKVLGDWQTKPTKQALEQLYIQGDLMISSRNNFHKVYDLTERVLPDDVDTSMPSNEEYARFLIIRYLSANGIGQVPEITYLLRNTKTLVSEALKDMTSSAEIIQLEVKGKIYYALPSSLEILEKPLGRSKLKILSPFDNLVIQRKRTSELFGFDYLLECYVPEPKRKFGYFVLPILWNGKLVARMDCKVDRKTEILHIRQLFLEPGLQKTDAFIQALSKELKSFSLFNNCKSILLNPINPDYIKEELQTAIDLN